MTPATGGTGSILIGGRHGIAMGRGDLARTVLAVFGFSLLAAATDFGFWHSRGYVQLLLLIPAALITLLAGECMIFCGAVTTVMAWPHLVPRHLFLVSLAIGATLGLVTGLSWWLYSSDFTLAWLSGIPTAIAYSWFSYQMVRRRYSGVAVRALRRGGRT